ncbi:unnamed protein product [Notodromas monacha]|uniref:Uncharacterized protein n=1 Tax=Notodromas monacha TaxID=399045 RepID=A0A7R9BK53_9CRUS|nr:unnamed protein product [Notodromas monacha]CAG0916722.1 unnamed protein product [Notodromas monacha]
MLDTCGSVRLPPNFCADRCGRNECSQVEPDCETVMLCTLNSAWYSRLPENVFFQPHLASLIRGGELRRKRGGEKKSKSKKKKLGVAEEESIADVWRGGG